MANRSLRKILIIIAGLVLFFAGIIAVSLLTRGHTRGTADAAQNPLFTNLCSAEEALQAAKKSNVVVIEDGVCTSGKDVWNVFYQKTQKASCIIKTDDRG